MTPAPVATRPHAVFIKTELKTGLTFAKIALESNDPNKVSRNTLNARKAYDTLLRFLRETQLDGDDDNEVRRQLAKLRSDLVQLGESV